MSVMATITTLKNSVIKFFIDGQLCFIERLHDYEERLGSLRSGMQRRITAVMVEHPGKTHKPRRACERAASQSPEKKRIWGKLDRVDGDDSTRNLLRKWDCLRLRIFLRLPSRPALLLRFGDSLSSSRRHSPLLGNRRLCATIVSSFGPSCFLRRHDPCPPRRRDLSSAVLFAICRTKGFECRGDSFNLFRQVIVFFAQELNYAADTRHFEDPLLGWRLYTSTRSSGQERRLTDMFLHNSDQRRTIEGQNTPCRQTIARRTLECALCRLLRRRARCE
jgi:hypothetical protein